MKLIESTVRGFRRLEDVSVDFEASDTVFVGPNNSGKTSMCDVFRLFLKSGDFSIHDFSVASHAEFDKFGRNLLNESDLPYIDLDLWFSIDPYTEYGWIGLLLPDVEQDYETVGLRLRYMVKDATKLKDGYIARFTPSSGGAPAKSLSQYLSLPGTLREHFGISYYALEGSRKHAGEHPLKHEEGARLLKSVLRVDFVDAQRRIDDSDSSSSTRLSKVLAAYYKRHLTQARAADSANELIDEHNDALTKHYAAEFADLLGVIKGLGVPAVNDRTLQIISSLVPEAVLQSNTTLTYRDESRNHDLPERYNGLGYKNLIYLAIQICEIHFNWMRTETARPLCLILFIEEPEVHLHAQAQQVFIANAWRIVESVSEQCEDKGKTPQIVVTTHSSHILDTVEFAHVRYFQRCLCAGDDATTTTTLNATKVVNLGRFNPDTDSSTKAKIEENASGEAKEEHEHKTDRAAILDFLKRYVKLTHCDLFFADAAILVEGSAEKLLMPDMIQRGAPGLRRRYLTVLEVGGAFSHRFAGLLEFLSIPYLVITDIDTVDPAQSNSTCRPSWPGAVTSNASIKYFLKVSSVAELNELSSSSQYVVNRRCYVAYQRPSAVAGYDISHLMHGRTFEDTFVFENIVLFRDGTLSLGKTWDVEQEYEKEYQTVYEAVKKPAFKKTDFALSVVCCTKHWAVPEYISHGLSWLARELRVLEDEGDGEALE